MLVFKAQKQDDKEERCKQNTIFLTSGIRKCGQFLTLPTYVLDSAYLCSWLCLLMQVLSSSKDNPCKGILTLDLPLRLTIKQVIRVKLWLITPPLQLGLVQGIKRSGWTMPAPLFWICNAPDLCGCCSSAWITFLLPAHSHPHTTFPLRWALLWARHNFNGNSSWK